MVDTWNKKELKLLLDQVKSKNIKSILEIGSYRGASTRNILLTNKKAKITCIDPMQGHTGHKETGNPTLDAFKKNTNEFKNRVTLIQKKSQDAVKDIKGTFDLIFIDGDHSYKGVEEDIKVIIPHMTNKTILLFHDIWLSEVYQAIKDSKLPQMGFKYADCAESLALITHHNSVARQYKTELKILAHKCKKKIWELTLKK